MVAPWNPRLPLWAYVLFVLAVNIAASNLWPTSIPIPSGVDTNGWIFTSSADYGCDGGRGVFSCPPIHGPPSQTLCYFNLKSAFGCCDPNNSCQAITTCIPLDNSIEDHTCDSNDHGCTSCTDPRSRYCFTVTNPIEQKYSIMCDSRDVASTTEFKFTFTGTYTPIPTLVNPSARPSVSNTLVATPTSTSDKSADSDHSTTHAHISVPAIVGVTIGTAGGLVILAIGLWFFFRRRKDAKPRDQDANNGFIHEHHEDKSTQGPEELEALHIGKGTFDGQDVTSEMEGNNILAQLTKPPHRQELHGTSPIPPPLLQSPGKEQYHAYSNNATNILGQRQYRACSPGAVVSTLSSELDAVPKESELDGMSQLSNPRPYSSADKHAPAVPAPTASQTAPSSSQIASPNPSTVPPVPNIVVPSSSQKDDDIVRVEKTSHIGNLEVPTPGDHNRRKSSALLATTAGPYLSADSALGEGYWEAEREQLRADKSIESGDENFTQARK